jgi:hypothetical protein
VRRFRRHSGELVGAAREELLALNVSVGLGVVHSLMEAEVDQVARWASTTRMGRRAATVTGGVDDARWPARRGQPSGGAHGR